MFFALVGLIIVGFRLAGFALYSIPSSSMYPTLLVGDYPVVLEYQPGYSRESLLSELARLVGRNWAVLPEQGDVAVFRNPAELSEMYIMRIVGLQGDRIQMKMGILHINGEPVKRQRIEDFEIRPGRTVPQYVETLPNGRVHRIVEESGDTGRFDNSPEFIVPRGDYFVMGDNRDNSHDSRFIGVVAAKNLVGRAEIVVFSSVGFGIRFDRIFHGVE